MMMFIGIIVGGVVQVLVVVEVVQFWCLYVVCVWVVIVGVVLDFDLGSVGQIGQVV